MELYLVYEFIYHNFDEDIQEAIEFFGLFQDKRDAKKTAYKRMLLGIKDYDVVPLEGITKNENPFEKSDEICMCREDDKDKIIYSICIKELKIK